MDSAFAGSHEAASLFCTSVSLPAKLPRIMNAMIQNPSTNHLVTGLVSLPAI